MLKTYITQCKALQIIKKSPLETLLLQCQNHLDSNDYDLSFFESLEHHNKEPMQIAIIGQFSSGKSTFLNALLGQNILPTGITPITSKVCKICYGEDYILEILYKDGNKVLQNVEFLHKLTRENSKNIDYFCLYAPILMLKEINFLDTPGFNSQNTDDTHTTLKILEGVDGIIWLTLIDNAGKNSEKILLREFSAHFAQKSLCVLNQKDRLKNASEVQTSVDYAKSAFDGIFFDCIPISAKLALNASLNTASKYLETELINLAHSIQALALKEKPEQELLENLNNLYTTNTQKINANLLHLDTQKAQLLMQESNMPLIFDFLNQTIKPKAHISKTYSTLKKLKEQHILLHLQYHKINTSYARLQKLLHNNMQDFHIHCKNSLEREQKVFNDLYAALDLLLDDLAQKIYNALQKQPQSFHYTKKTLFSNKQLQNTKEVTMLPLEKIRIALYNADTQLVKDYKAISVKIKAFLDSFVQSITQNTEILNTSITNWQNTTPKYIAPFCVARNSTALKTLHLFLQNIYTEIVLDFEKGATNAIAYLQSELNVLSNFLSLNYENGIDLTLTKLDLKIKNAITKHQQNQEEFALFNPTLENIRENLNEAFCFEQFQARLFGPMNSLKKAYALFLNTSQTTTDEKINKIISHTQNLKKEVNKIMLNLQTIKNAYKKVES